MRCRTCDATNDPGTLVCRICGKDPHLDPWSQPPAAHAVADAPSILLPPPDLGRVKTGPTTALSATGSVASGVVGWLIVALGAATYSAGSGVAWIIPVPIFIGLAGVLLGHHAQRAIRESKGAIVGKPYASLGLILGYLLLVPGGLLLLGMCVYVSVAAGLERILA